MKIEQTTIFLPILAVSLLVGRSVRELAAIEMVSGSGAKQRKVSSLEKLSKKIDFKLNCLSGG